MSRSDVRIGHDDRPYIPLNTSNSDRYRHLDNSRQCQSNQPKISKKQLEKMESCCVYISVIISVASIASSAILIYLYSSREVQLADDFCVPCEKLKFSPFPNENEKYRILEKDYENGVEICCGSTTKSTEALLDLISERKLRESKAQERNAEIRDGYFKGSQMSAHILMSGYDETGNEKRPVKLLNDSKLSHLNGIKIANDRINIFTKGKYFVYCQLYFKLILGTNLYKSEEVLSYHISRYNSKLDNDKTFKLLKGKFTVKLKYIDDHDFSTKFTSGIFDLEAGDQLYVMVTNTSFISRLAKHNFIGLYLLG